MMDSEETQPGRKEHKVPEPVIKEATGKNFTWLSASISEVGRVRSLNEDACVELPEKRIWAVADGMGGHDAGDKASRLIIDSLLSVRHQDSFSAFVDAVEDTLIEVHEELFRRGEARGQIGGSTLVALLVRNCYALVMWAGDSRAYLFRNDTLTRITQDHSVVAELLERGEISPEEAAVHPEANVITRAVGAVKNLYLDMDIVEIKHGDNLLLCSDGLYREVAEQEISAILHRHYSPAKAVQEMVELALSRGGRDNITGVVIRAVKNV